MSRIWTAYRRLKVSKAGGWNQLKSHLLSCVVEMLAVDSRPQFFSMCNLPSQAWLGFLTGWWLGSKGKHPNRKGAKWELEVSQPHFILFVRDESQRPAHIPGEEKSGSTSPERRVKEFVDMF